MTRTAGTTGAITVYGHAKINLFLGIVGEYGQGFHALAMVMQSISLADALTLTPAIDIQLTCDHPTLPCDARNLAFRAAQLLQERSQSHRGVTIHIEKRIPIGAGLAGGSADAAAVLVGLNHLWGLGLTLPELAELGSQLGSDIPFCVMGGTMLATGRGEVLEPLSPLTLPLLLIKPNDVSIATPWAYQTHRQLRQQHPGWQVTPIQPMLEAIEHIHSPSDLIPHLHNDLEWPVLLQHPDLADLKASLQQDPDVLGVLMSGSGSAFFTLVADDDAAKRCAARWQSPTLSTWAVRTLDHGVTVYG
ncbi:MAG: 4-(cytidine 5'-diphospho)-2-C-methyl-D-erythritol kinase [Synechococcales cyanobacterium]